MRKIVVHPDICNGEPTLEGTRITVRTVLDFISAGDSIDDLLAEYPTLSRDDVLACVAWPARSMPVITPPISKRPVNQFVFATDADSQAFCDEIVDSMVELFDIPVEEALGRINKQWATLPFDTHDDALCGRYRDDAEFWAHRIYYDSRVCMWTRGQSLPAKPYP